MKNLTLTILSIFSMLSIYGCQSGEVMQAGGFRMIHFNNPECMGSSASGGLIVEDRTGEVVKSNIGFKTGYCEAVTGQVIAVGGEVGKAHILSNGLKKSGQTEVNTQNLNSTDTSVVDLGTGGPPNVPNLPQ